jgi:hypothetical protein
VRTEGVQLHDYKALQDGEGAAAEVVTCGVKDLIMLGAVLDALLDQFTHV